MGAERRIGADGHYDLIVLIAIGAQADVGGDVAKRQEPATIDNEGEFVGQAMGPEPHAERRGECDRKRSGGGDFSITRACERSQ